MYVHHALIIDNGIKYVDQDFRNGVANQLFTDIGRID